MLIFCTISCPSLSTFPVLLGLHPLPISPFGQRSIVSHSDPSSSCGIANETLAHITLTAISSFASDFPTTISAIESLFIHTIPLLPAFFPSEATSPNLTTPSHEHLYGLAGTLYLLRLARHYLIASPPSVNGPSVPTDAKMLFSNLSSTIEFVANAIVDAGPHWTWHSKPYIGAIHGTAGILAQLCLTVPDASLRYPQLYSWLSSLLDTQLPSGNFPSSVDSPRDELVQICHGAPGVVLSLLAIKRSTTLPSSLAQRVDVAIERGREDVLRRGMLRKAPTLCHGTVGNALAMDQGKRSYLLRRAGREIVDRLVEKGEMAEMEGFGLYTGEAGRAWGWMVEMGWLEGMIGFSEI